MITSKRILPKFPGNNSAQIITSSPRKEIHHIAVKHRITWTKRETLWKFLIIYKTNTPYDKDYLKKLESNIVAP